MKTRARAPDVRLRHALPRRGRTPQARRLRLLALMRRRRDLGYFLAAVAAILTPLFF